MDIFNDDKIGLFDDDNWDDVLDGDYVYLSHEFPPRVYLIRKTDGEDKGKFRFQYSESEPLKKTLGISSELRKRLNIDKKLIALKRFNYDEDRLVYIDDFSNDSIKEYINSTIEFFKKNNPDDDYRDMIRQIEEKLNDEKTYRFINKIIKKLKTNA